MRAYRKQDYSRAGWWPAARTGIFVALVVAVLVGLMEFAYILANPGFYEQYGEIYLTRMTSEGASATEIAAAKEQMEAYAFMANPVVSGVFYFFETTLVGTVAAMIIAIFMRKK